MRAVLNILEKSRTGMKRRRVINITAESVTLGGPDTADIHLDTLPPNFSVEIKQADGKWWLINPMRLRGVKINRGAVSLERVLENGDEIEILGHQINFGVEEGTNAQRAGRFSFTQFPSTDEDLWAYLLTETEFDEILINGPKDIYVDYRGNLIRSPYKFQSEDFLIGRIREKTNLTSPKGWVSWQVDRTLRIHGVLPPMIEHVHLSIRKAKKKLLSLNELEQTDFASPEEIAFLRKAIKENQNIIISGGTSTGKTVLLRSLVEQIPQNQRIVLLEEEAETSWPHPHLVAVEVGRGNLEGAVIESLRMRPSRLIISEVRGPEALDLLQAMNTGHPGSMTTIHSNSSREALSRLETLALTANPSLTSSATRKQISDAVDIIVQLERLHNGERKIKEIVRVTGIQKDTILLSDPVHLEAQGLDQKLRPA